MTDIKQVLPGHETQSEEMNCPSCKRYVGAVTRCPYCKAKVPKRMSLMATRWAAVLLATIGLFLLYLMAVNREIPVIMLGDIEPTMNFGQVRIVGQVLNDARTFRNGGMGFNVTDGTGSIMVFVSPRQAQDLQSQDRVPRAGDSIDFAGGLSVRDQDMSIRLLSVNELRLTRAPVKEVRLGDIHVDMEGSGVVIAGQVTSFTTPAPGTRRPYALKVSDGSAEMTINFWDTEYEQIEDPDRLDGAYIRARVSVGSYRNQLQLTLSSGADLEILDAPPEPPARILTPAQKAAETHRRQTPPPARDFSRGRSEQAAGVPVSSVTPDQKGQTIRVRGLVRSVTPPREGTRQPFSVILADDDATLRVVYWSNVDEVLATKPEPGAVFEMEGVVDVHEGRPSLKVESGYRVRAIEAPPAPDTSDVTPISSISKDDVGQTRSLQGTLGEPRSLGRGTAFTLDDGTGTMDLVLWNSLVPVSLTSSLSEGMRVVATGEISEYQDQLQLKAARGRSVRVLR